MFAGKADTAAKGKFTLDPVIGIAPPDVDYTVSWNGDDVSLVDRLADVATTSAGGSTPLIVAGGQVKIEAPPRSLGKRTIGCPRVADLDGALYAVDEILNIRLA